ncbi:MAG: STAS domain-containing protein [Planctomycetota bacterium]|nr:STAS domain-containing protein [Planctomycetota bacterium]
MDLVLEIGSKFPEISGPVSDTFANYLNTVCEKEDFNELVLDLGGTRMISSMAMGSIFAVYQRLHEKGKTLRVVNASDKVTHLLRMVNLADILLK